MERIRERIRGALVGHRQAIAVGMAAMIAVIMGWMLFQGVPAKAPSPPAPDPGRAAGGVLSSGGGSVPVSGAASGAAGTAGKSAPAAGRSDPFAPLVASGGSGGLPPVPSLPPAVPSLPPVPALPLPQGVGPGPRTSAPSSPPPLRLTGIIGDADALAIVADEKGSHIVGRGDEIGPGTQVVRVDAKRGVVEVRHDGVVMELTLRGGGAQ